MDIQHQQSYKGDKMEETFLLNELRDKEQKFVLHAVTNPDASAAESARQAGVAPASARNRGYEMKNTPQIQQAIAELSAKIGDVGDIDIKGLVNSTLINQVMNAKADRDKQTAAIALGKTQAMFTDVVETTAKDYDDKALLDDIEHRFGKEAREIAAQELGEE